MAIHLRYEGQSYDISFEQLNDIGDASPDSNIFTALAEYLNVPRTKFNGMSVSRNEGEITIRPNAPFGR